MESNEMKILLETGTSNVADFAKLATGIIGDRFGYMLETSRSLETGISPSFDSLPEGWSASFQNLVMFDAGSEIMAEPGGKGVCYRILSEKGGNMPVGLCRESRCLLAKVRQAQPFRDAGFESLLSKEYFKVDDDSGMLVKIASRLALA